MYEHVLFVRSHMIRSKNKVTRENASLLIFISCKAEFLFIMAAVRSRCGHYILQLWFFLSLGRPME